MCQRRSRKQFSAMWKPCEVGASLFMRSKKLITPFSRAVKHVEACLSAIEDRESSFEHFGSTVMLVQACLCAGKT